MWSEGCYCEKGKDEKNGRKAGVFQIYIYKDSDFPLDAILELGLRHPPPI